MRILNKKVLHNYYILERHEAGAALLGSEVKALRTGRADLGNSYVKVINNELYLVNANIPKLVSTSQKNYEPTRSRKLLLHQAQIKSLIGKISRSGITLVPLSIYTKNNRFKVEVAVAKSKKQFDKRKALKEKDHQRRIQQELRGKE